MMSINKLNYTIVAQELIKELTNNITGNNEDWLFGKVPSKHVMIGMIDGGQKEESVLVGDESESDRRETIPSIGLRFYIDNNSKEIVIKLQGKLFYRIKPSYDDEVKFLLDKYTKKTGINFETVDELLSYIDDCKKTPEFAEPKEGIVNFYKSINLSQLGEFVLNIADFNNSLNEIYNSQ